MSPHKSLERALELEREEAEVAAAVAKHVGLTSVADPRVVEELARAFKTTPKEVPARVQKLVEEAEGLALKVRATRAAPLGDGSGDLLARVIAVQEDLKRLHKLADQQAAQAAAGAADSLVGQATLVSGISLIAAQIDGLDGKALRTLAETLQGKKPGVVILGSASDGKAGLVVAASKDAVAKGVSAGALIGGLAPLVGGKGGGKADMAMAGGTDATNLDAALKSVQPWVSERI